MPVPGAARQPGAVGAAEGAEALRWLGAGAVVGAGAEGGDGAFEEGVVVPARARGAADHDRGAHVAGVHAGPVVGLLAGHGEAEDGVEVGDVQVLGQEGVLGVDAVSVVEGWGEGGRVGGRGGFAVAEHGDDDHVVGAQGAVGEGEGRVDEAAVAGGDADGFRGRGVVGAVGDFDGHAGAGDECEGGDSIVFDTGGIIIR